MTAHDLNRLATSLAAFPVLRLLPAPRAAAAKHRHRHHQHYRDGADAACGDVGTSCGTNRICLNNGTCAVRCGSQSVCLAGCFCGGGLGGVDQGVCHVATQCQCVDSCLSCPVGWVCNGHLPVVVPCSPERQYRCCAICGG